MSIAGAGLWGLLWAVAPERAYEGPLEPTPTASAPRALPAGVGDASKPAGVPEPFSAESETESESMPKAEASPPAEESSVRTIRVGTPDPEPSTPDRASTLVTRRELQERLPRSAPDALRYEPGVYVQQTAHSQGSPYVRGLTGQQTVMFFDGVRLNNSTFRQGPNQYFFTIDSRTIDSLEVLRGSASTRYGSDALGGALLSMPVQPSLDLGRRPLVVHARGSMRTATADAEVGGRAQVDLSYRGKLGVLAGVGYRNVGQLKSGGRINQPATGMPQVVPPAFEVDDATQKGTGFGELAADTRLVWQPKDRHRFTLAYYDYRQFDAPRTDKCPPPTAPLDECLKYDEQFRTLVYGAFEELGGPVAAEQVRLTLSYQRQHEDRELDRGSPSSTRLDGIDDVHSIGSSLRIESHEFAPAPWLGLQVHYGADAYYDRIDSEASIVFDDVMITSELSRGQYLDDAQYLTSGAWTELHTELFEAVRLRTGGRLALVHAQAEGDDESESLPIDDTWFSAVGSIGLAVDAVPWLTFIGNVDQGFRAPNLDDLTSRQQTGPGFQFENANLEPERSLSLETGAKVRTRWLQLDGWVFRTTIDNLIGRVARTVEDCPMNDPGCGASQTRFQLDNFEGQALLWGAEGSLRLLLPYGIWTRATVSWAKGDRPNPFASPGESPSVPMSRVPPLNGTAELGWRSWFGLYAAAGLRWARLQDRLAPQDVADARIPRGGTPGYEVLELRAGYRWDPHVLLSLVFENVTDAAWRGHGSSVNGPGRGLILEAQFGF